MDAQKTTIHAIRILSAEAIEKAKSGHPGLPLGCAPIAYNLFQNFLKFNPKDPKWDNRDRFILSAGHGSMLNYSLLYLYGYGLQKEDLMEFRQLGSKTPGHPEYSHTVGVETTTGPLGQGIANAVGMALAEANLAAKYNRPGFEVVDHYTYAICGDGCLQEGIAYEACSFAGTHALGKLILFYDDNDITIEGDTDVTFKENVGARFAAQNWQVLHVDLVSSPDDIEALKDAVEKAKAKEQPAKTQEQPAKKPSKPAKVKPCAEKIEEMFYGDDYTENIAKDLISKNIFGNYDKNFIQTMLESMVIKPAFENHINELNVQFDQDIKKGNQNEAMAKLVRGVFKVADEYQAYIVGNSKLGRVQACGILAKTLIDNLTAVAVYPQLSSLANEYIDKNVSIYKEIFDADLFYDEAINDYALDQNATEAYTLEELMKMDQTQSKNINNVNDDVSSVYSDDVGDYEPAFDDDNPFVENSGEIAPQVSQEPKQNVPTISNSK